MDMMDVYVRLKLLSEKSGSDQQDAILALVDEIESYLGDQNKTPEIISENENSDELTETGVSNGHDIEQYIKFNCKFCHGKNGCGFYKSLREAKADGFDRINTDKSYECENIQYGAVTASSEY